MGDILPSGSNEPLGKTTTKCKELARQGGAGNGSPKVKGSTSEALAGTLKDCLSSKEETC